MNSLKPDHPAQFFQTVHESFFSNEEEAGEVPLTNSSEAWVSSLPA